MSFNDSIKSKILKIVKTLSHSKLPIDILRAFELQSKLLTARQKSIDRLNADPWGVGICDNDGKFYPHIQRIVDNFSVIAYEECFEQDLAYIRAKMIFEGGSCIRTKYRREKMLNSDVKGEELVEYFIDFGKTQSEIREQVLRFQYRWIPGEEMFTSGENVDNENINLFFDDEVIQIFSKLACLDMDISDTLFFLMTIPFHEAETEVDVLLAKLIFGEQNEEEQNE